MTILTVLLLPLIACSSGRPPGTRDEVRASLGDTEPLSTAVGPVHDAGSNVNIAVSDTGVEPANLVVNPGTTLVWVNSGQSPIRVRFTSHAVSTSCKAPQGFALNAKGIYGSEKLEGGELASICIIEPNVYDYQVEYLSSDSQQAPVERVVLGRVRVESF